MLSNSTECAIIICSSYTIFISSSSIPWHLPYTVSEILAQIILIILEKKVRDLHLIYTIGSKISFRDYALTFLVLFSYTVYSLRSSSLIVVQSSYLGSPFFKALIIDTQTWSLECLVSEAVYMDLKLIGSCATMSFMVIYANF